MKLAGLWFCGVFCSCFGAGGYRCPLAAQGRGLLASVACGRTSHAAALDVLGQTNLRAVPCCCIWVALRWWAPRAHTACFRLHSVVVGWVPAACGTTGCRRGTYMWVGAAVDRFCDGCQVWYACFECMQAAPLWGYLGYLWYPISANFKCAVLRHAGQT